MGGSDPVLKAVFLAVRVRVGMVERSIIMQMSATPGKSNLHSGLPQQLAFIYSSMCMHTLVLNYTAVASGS